MANEQNLKPMGTGLRSESEERALRVKGGVNSGKTRRRKRAMKDAAKLLLDMPIAQENIAKQMRSLGFDEKDLTNQMAMIVSIWREAMDGNVRAAEFMRDTVGQNVHDIQQREEFEYRKERDAGISQEIEDLDEIEAEIYGKEETGRQENQKERPEAETDDSVPVRRNP